VVTRLQIDKAHLTDTIAKFATKKKIISSDLYALANGIMTTVVAEVQQERQVFGIAGTSDIDFVNLLDSPMRDAYPE